MLARMAEMAMPAWTGMAFQSRTLEVKPAPSQCSRTSVVREVRLLFLATSKATSPARTTTR